MTGTAIVSLIVGLIGVGGIGGAIVAVAKLRPEAGQIVVQSAQGAVIVQAGVIESLTEELERVKADYQELAEQLRDRVTELESERKRLTLRVGELETQNLQLREELDVIKQQTNGK